MPVLTKYATGADGSRGSVAFTNPGNVSADDAAYATASLARRVDSNEYWLIPAFTEVGASDTINAVTVEVEWRVSAIAATARRFSLYVGTTERTPVLSGTSDPTTDTVQSFSPSLTAGDVRGDNGGLAVYTSFMPDDADITGYIDFIRVTVDYTGAASETHTTSGTATAVASASATSSGGNAASYLFTEQFEGGAVGETITASNTIFNIVTIQAGATATFDTPAVEGSKAMRVTSGGTAASAFGQVGATILGTRTLLFTRLYLYLPALPPANVFIQSTNLGGAARTTLRINSNGTVAIRNGNLAVWTSTTALTAGAWHRIEWRMDATNLVQQCRLFVGDNRHGTTATEDSGNATFDTGSIDTFLAGIVVASANQNYLIDSLKIDETDWIGPESTTSEVHTTAGTATAVGSAAGSTSGTRSTSGTATAVGTAASSSTSVHTVTGTATAVGSATGSTSGTRSTSGTAPSVASATGSTAGVRPTSGTAPAVASATGTTSATRSTSGTAPAVASATSSSTGVHTTTGTATATATATYVGSGSEVHATTGNAVAAATATGSTASTHVVDETATATATAGSTGTSVRSTSGTASATATATAGTGGVRPTSGTATAVATASGVHTTDEQHTTSGTAVAGASASAVVSSTRATSGSAVARVSAAAAIGTLRAATATAWSHAAAGASTTTLRTLAADAVAVATADAAVTSIDPSAGFTTVVRVKPGRTVSVASAGRTLKVSPEAGERTTVSGGSRQTTITSASRSVTTTPLE